MEEVEYGRKERDGKKSAQRRREEKDLLSY